MFTTKRKRTQGQIGPEANGTLMTPEEFDCTDFDECWRYELVNGVLIVSSLPFEEEADPNDELGYRLRTYQANHPQGASLDVTLSGRPFRIGANYRWPDRLIWAGMGCLPRNKETPTILVDFVPAAKRNLERDYEVKRDEYQKTTVQEYWIIDRFDRTLVVFSRRSGKFRKRIIHADQTYKTPLLPGFELPLARLFALADRWVETPEEKRA